MGVFRLLLSLSVVRAHRPFFEPFFFIQSGTAVIYFYIISGFYMSYVILSKYSREEEGRKNFLIGRTLRLYPCYWAVLAITIAGRAWLRTPTVYTSPLDLTAGQRLIMLFSDTFIVGTDVIFSGAVLKWNAPPSGGLDLNWNKMLIMQAWTLGVEITFYVFAIFFIFRDKGSRWTALALAVYIRIYFLLINGKFLGFSRDGIGYSNTPWGYHSFGVALIYFMFGYLSYEGYRRLQSWAVGQARRLVWIRGLAITLVGLLVGIWSHFDGLQTIADYNDYRVWITIPIVVALIPVLFFLTKNSKLDAMIGLLSYPLYLDHVIASDLGATMLPASLPKKWATLISISIMTLALVLLLEWPLELIRKRRSQKLLRRAEKLDTIAADTGA